MPLHLIALLSMALALPAQADIYKCKLANGGTEISNTPCASGSGTLSVRPDETVPDASRQQAERDVARMRDFVSRREAEQQREEAAERKHQTEERQRVVTQRVYETPDMTACLRELGQLTLDSQRRGELEAVCRAKPRQDPVAVAVPIVVGGQLNATDACIHNVQRQHLDATERARRIAACRGQAVTPDKPPRPAARAPTRPLKPCPRDDRYCVR